jgi:hypothetical protein
MTPSEKDKAKKIIRNFYNMLNIAQEKNVSDYIYKKISTILKEESKLGIEQKSQAILKITDILNNSKNEEEIIQKLNEEYPTA